MCCSVDGKVSGIGVLKMDIHQALSNIRTVENRASHVNMKGGRGHIRTLKDGRKVYIRSSIVNKGGAKIVYRIENVERR